MGKYKRLFSNMAIFSMSIVLSKLLLSFMLPLYTRTLTTAEYGKAELLTNISQLLIPLCSAAIPSAVFRFSMDADTRRENVLKSGSFFLSVTAVLFVAGTFCLRWVPALAGYELYFFLISFLTVLRSLFSLYLKACEKNILFSADVLIYNLTLCLCNIGFLSFLKAGLDGYFLSVVTANAVSVCLLLFCGKLYQPLMQGRTDKILLGKMLAYSAPLIFTNIVWALISTTDKFMITAQLSDSANGIYSAASKIPAVISMISEIFSEAWVLSAIQDYGGGNEKVFYENVFFLLHTALSGMILVLFAVNHTLVPWFLGNDFEASADYTPLLLFSTYLTGYSGYYSPLFSAVKKNSAIMISTILGVSCNLLLNFLLIPRTGIYGACIATVASSAVICIYRVCAIRKYMIIDTEVPKWAFSVLLTACAMVMATLCRHETLVSVLCMITLLAVYRKRVCALANYISDFFSKKGKLL